MTRHTPRPRPRRLRTRAEAFVAVALLPLMGCGGADPDTARPAPDRVAQRQVMAAPSGDAAHPLGYCEV